ncbi:NAD(P)-dependent oxidoreductase [Natribacillus halophilus]|uniref:3-hydroxyisobutyrate dehydrogenase n=1 Tax=Natribacillus halophilus TaxID=549003 RepID=A0A1G8PB69_9BACI|nr:NAD(P)-dependent oxidoreductase [Natribacillus halophilus]SDI89545.1 3-hydroxyisobutyrate dehydrogenase [Natribacillus halophilus]
MQKVGVVGLGSIGFNMAKNLVEAGYELSVFDINPHPMDELERYGARKTNSPREVGASAHIVFLMVQNFSQCESCLTGNDGIMQGMEDGAIIVTSTIAPDEVREIEGICSKKGIEVLDSPVSGGVKGAESGSLTLMVAGKKELYDFCLPVLHVVGSNVRKVGDEIGLGQAIKAVNQHLVSIHLVAMAEALALGVKGGLDPELIYDVVKDSAGNSWMFEDKVPGILERDFLPRSSLDIQKKDLDICIHTGNQLQVPLFLGSACKEIYKLADAKNLDQEDSSTLVKIYEELGDLLVTKDDSKNPERGWNYAK